MGKTSFDSDTTSVRKSRLLGRERLVRLRFCLSKVKFCIDAQVSENEEFMYGRLLKRESRVLCLGEILC